jgi:hypothetical protein
MDQQQPSPRQDDSDPRQPPPADPREGISAPAAGSSADEKTAAAEHEAALERERWLRACFEEEHQITVSLMRLLVSGVRGEGRARRFWRWLIDDLRSEQRLLAYPHAAASEENVLVSRIRAWFWRRGADQSGDTGRAG